MDCFRAHVAMLQAGHDYRRRGSGIDRFTIALAVIAIVFASYVLVRVIDCPYAVNAAAPPENARAGATPANDYFIVTE
jgi:hypothetical protein